MEGRVRPAVHGLPFTQFGLVMNDSIEFAHGVRLGRAVGRVKGEILPETHPGERQ